MNEWKEWKPVFSEINIAVKDFIVLDVDMTLVLNNFILEVIYYKNNV